MIVSNIYGWRGIEGTEVWRTIVHRQGSRDPCGKFEAEGLTSVEMMIFI